jgi:putative flippase GtrA
MSQGAAYVLSALASTLVNLAVQEACRRIASGEALAVPLLAGTAAGFFVKYAMDKRLVFSDPYADLASEFRKVFLSGLFSVATTLVFWGAEIVFWMAWRTHEAKYAGAVLGLTVGYVAKFGLDRVYVFRGAAT